MAAYSHSQMRQWLNYVDINFPAVAQEFLKLHLCSEVDHKMLESLKSVSQIFDHLESRTDADSALQILVTAMHRMKEFTDCSHFVQTLVNYNISKPPLLKDNDLSKEFKFYQMLVKIGSKIYGTNAETMLKQFIVQRNPSYLVQPESLSLPAVLMSLSTGRRPVLRWNNTQQLVDAFRVCGTTCYLHYLNQYYMSVGLTPLDTHETADATSSSEPFVNDSPYNYKGSAAKEEIVAEWLHNVVDEKLKSESVNILKLGFRGELSEQAKFDLIFAKKPSQLYAILKKQMQSDTLTLERFVFALNQLGDHHRGTVCVRLLSSKFNDLTPFDPNTLSKHSQLLQCLVSISVALSRRMRRQLIAYFAVLRNYSYGLSISQLFTMVLNDEVVTDEDQTILVQGLAIIGASTQCFEYVNVYRKRNKLPEIAVNRDTLQVDQRQKPSRVNGLRSTPEVEISEFEDNGKGRQLLNWVKKQFGAMHPTPVSEPTLSQNEERIGDLVIFRNYHIGSGAFGYVFRGKFGPTPCAIKVLNPLGMEFVASLPVGSNALQNSAQQKALDHFNKECKFLEQIKHKNIVQYMTTLLHPKSGFPVLVLELLDCTLRQYISNDISNDMLPDPVQLSLCYDIALALELLHEKDIVHRDLCGDNVLLKLKQPSGIPVAKVSDFGMSRIIDCDTLSEKLTILGHRKGYMPIEAYSSCYNSSLDIFMFGVVMTQIALKIPNVKTKLERKQFIDKISATHPLKNIILNCTKENADERLHANQICKELKKYLPKHS